MKRITALFVAAVVVMSMVAVGTAVAAKNGQAGNSNTAHLNLFEKDGDPDWNIVDDGAWGKMKFNLSGPTFDFVFNGKGLEPNTEYSLIYYADEPDRFVNWGGNNPGALIASGTSNGGGNIHLGGSTELNMDLPHPIDANANISNHDYSGPPDYYATATGAKIWLVLSSDYNATTRTMTAWNPTEYLFESDLINYDDTEVTYP